MSRFDGPWPPGPYRTVLNSSGLQVCGVNDGKIEDAVDAVLRIAAAPTQLVALIKAEAVLVAMDLNHEDKAVLDEIQAAIALTQP